MSTAVDQTCKHCGTIHGPLCPFIKAVEYYENGTVKRVEYHNRPPLNPNPFPWAPITITD